MSDAEQAREDAQKWLDALAADECWSEAAVVLRARLAALEAALAHAEAVAKEHEAAAVEFCAAADKAEAALREIAESDAATLARERDDGDPTPSSSSASRSPSTNGDTVSETTTHPVLGFAADWPEVRCATCATVYPVEAHQDGPITGRCPKCGGGKFNTRMTVGEGFSATAHPLLNTSEPMTEQDVALRAIEWAMSRTTTGTPEFSGLKLAKRLLAEREQLREALRLIADSDAATLARERNDGDPTPFEWARNTARAAVAGATC
jgi:hypothetical protein